eukprot:TRINITY_DN954_c0_g2_i2.p1 TRINITY_DN954_c0_g2~~TRINITY_DN954_c0_g2_i2.p1  ORF type:complete len:290 (-),score=91.64 TRINITY_DN954_c0_g2_i2:116-892(-)
MARREVDAQERAAAADPGRWGGVDRVVGNIFISSYPASLQWDVLTSLNITHVVSVANTMRIPPRSLPADANISYLHVRAADVSSQDLIPSFPIVIRFVNSAPPGAGILFHCKGGRSRSVALLAAYLMYEQKLSPESAVAAIERARYIAEPNEGFLEQLDTWRSCIRMLTTDNCREVTHQISEDDVPWSWPPLSAIEYSGCNRTQCLSTRRLLGVAWADAAWEVVTYATRKALGRQLLVFTPLTPAEAQARAQAAQKEL